MEIRKKGFMFSEYRDKRGCGDRKFFDTPEDAVKYAKQSWFDMCEADKESYRKDSVGEFGAFMVDLVWDCIEEEFIATDYDPIWNALTDELF